MARPKSPTSSLRTRRIVFRLSESEYLCLCHKASTQGIKPNAYARLLVLAAPQTGETTTSLANPAFIKQIYHIGHNLNQLTKNAHIFGRVSPRVETLAKRIEALMDEALLNTKKEDT